MHPAGGGVGIGGLVEEKRGLAGERLGFRSGRGDRDDRTRQPQPHLAEHESAGRAAQSHHGESALGVGREPRFEFAGRFFEASLQLFAIPIRKFALRRCARGPCMPLASQRY